MAREASLQSLKCSIIALTASRLHRIDQRQSPRLMIDSCRDSIQEMPISPLRLITCDFLQMAVVYIDATVSQPGPNPLNIET